MILCVLLMKMHPWSATRPQRVVFVRSVHQLSHLISTEIEPKHSPQAKLAAKLAALYIHPIHSDSTTQGYSGGFPQDPCMSPASTIHIRVNATGLHPAEHVGSQSNGLVSAGM